MSLQLSGTFPSFLIEALPPLFLTQFNDWISEATLSSQPAPPHLQIRKFYYQTHVDLILNQFREVKDLGEAASEEWLKGLDLQRQERLHDANRWEQWEQNGGLRNFMTNRTQKTPPAAMGSIGKQSSLPFLGNNGMPVPTVPTYVDEGIPTYHFQGPPPMPMIPPMLHMPFQGKSLARMWNQS